MTQRFDHYWCKPSFLLKLEEEEKGMLKIPTSIGNSNNSLCTSKKKFIDVKNPKKNSMMHPCWTMKEKGAAIENHSINAKRMLDIHNMEAHVKYIKYMEMPFNIWLEHVNNRVLQFVCVPYKVSQKWWTLTTN